MQVLLNERNFVSGGYRLDLRKVNKVVQLKLQTVIRVVSVCWVGLVGDCSKYDISVISILLLLLLLPSKYIG